MSRNVTYVKTFVTLGYNVYLGTLCAQSRSRRRILPRSTTHQQKRPASFETGRFGLRWGYGDSCNNPLTPSPHPPSRESRQRGHARAHRRSALNRPVQSSITKKGGATLCRAAPVRVETAAIRPLRRARRGRAGHSRGPTRSRCSFRPRRPSPASCAACR